MLRLIKITTSGSVPVVSCSNPSHAQAGMVGAGPSHTGPMLYAMPVEQEAFMAASQGAYPPNYRGNPGGAGGQSGPAAQQVGALSG